MAHMGLEEVHNMETSHQGGTISKVAREGTWRTPHQSAWASLVPKIAGNGLKISIFQKLLSLSSLGIKEHAWDQIEANQQGHEGGQQD